MKPDETAFTGYSGASQSVRSTQSNVASTGVVQQTLPMTSLARHVYTSFLTNAEHRRISGIDKKLMDNLMACQSEHKPEDVKKMAELGIPPEIFVPITDTKRRAAMAQLTEIFNAPGDKPWTLSPTPMPRVPDSIAKEAYSKMIVEIADFASKTGKVPTSEYIFRRAQERVDEIYNQQNEWAKTRCERMERKVHDILIEGGWLEAFNDYKDFICTYGTALIIGPQERVMPVSGCKEGKLGQLKYFLEYKKIPTFEAVSPWDCFPSPRAKTVFDGPLCIRVEYTSDELWRFVDGCADSKTKEQDASGWIPSVVTELLAKYPNGGCKLLAVQPYEVARRRLEKDGADNGNDCTLEGIRCFSSVKGSALREFGIFKAENGETIDPRGYYEVEAIMIDNFIVYCKILDPKVGRPIVKGCFYDKTGSWWGEAPADKLVTTQAIMNAILKNIIVNMAMSSGGMFWMNNSERLVDKSDGAFRIRPWKMFVFNTGLMGQTGAPMGTISVSSNLQELWTSFEKAKAQADEDSGIPAYTYGTNVSGGAGRTASGLAMLTEAANRGMKMVISNTDRNVNRETIKKTVVHVLLYDDDISLKGDCEVNPAGIMGNILREQETQKRNQLLSIVSTNQALSSIVGPKGLIALLRPSIQALGVNPDDILPSKQRLEDLEALENLRLLNQSMSPMQGGPSGAVQPSGVGAQQQVGLPQRMPSDIQQDPGQAALVRGAPQQGAVAERAGAA